MKHLRNTWKNCLASSGFPGAIKSSHKQGQSRRPEGLFVYTDIAINFQSSEAALGHIRIEMVLPISWRVRACTSPPGATRRWGAPGLSNTCNGGIVFQVPSTCASLWEAQVFRMLEEASNRNSAPYALQAFSTFWPTWRQALHGVHHRLVSRLAHEVPHQVHICLNSCSKLVVGVLIPPPLRMLRVLHCVGLLLFGSGTTESGNRPIRKLGVKDGRALAVQCFPCVLKNALSTISAKLGFRTSFWRNSIRRQE